MVLVLVFLSRLSTKFPQPCDDEDMDDASYGVAEKSVQGHAHSSPTISKFRVGSICTVNVISWGSSSRSLKESSRFVWFLPPSWPLLREPFRVWVSRLFFPLSARVLPGDQRAGSISLREFRLGLPSVFSPCCRSQGHFCRSLALFFSLFSGIFVLRASCV